MKLVVIILIALIVAGLSFVVKNNHPIYPVNQSPIQTAPSPQPTLSPTPTPAPLKLIHLTVPFTSQSPFAQWSDPRQQDACEEASALMAMKWVKEESIASKESALREILAISAYQTSNFGNFHDTSAADTVERIFKGYYNYSNVKSINNITVQDIITALQDGEMVITPMNGRALNNPHFTPPGPERHMIVIIGYDLDTNEFITNDPGIAQGKDYRYPVDVFYKAIRDYPTGDHLPIVGEKKNMIVIKKS